MKKFKRFLKGLLIVILVLAVIHGIASMVLSRRVASKLAEIKAQGDPVSMADLGKIDIPDSENGATIYMQIFKEMGRPIEFKNGKYILNWDMKRDPELSRILIANEITPDMWMKAEKLLAPYQHAMGMVDEATSRPRCKFRTNWEDGPDAVFPHYTVLRSLSRMLMLDARLDARDGKVDKAVHRIGQIFKVGKSLTEDPSVVSLLLQMEMITNGLDCIKDIEQDAKISAAQARYLDDILARIDFNSSYQLAIKGEIALSVYIYNMYIGNAKPSSDMPWYGGIVLCVLRPIILGDELVFLRLAGDIPKNSSIPYIEMPQSKPGYIGRHGSSRFVLPSSFVIEGYSAIAKNRDIAISRIRLGRAYLGLIAYKEKFGAYPQSLDELRSKLGWKVEVDPLTGKDFHYKRQGAGFLLYGVGPNLRDDGGVFRRRKATDPPNEEFDDIVWQWAR